ncbi:MAG: O-antigen ligase family protein [Clostridia bacterium]|nr:O-antigen ligase family protein [Clostridia bacterium]
MSYVKINTNKLIYTSILIIVCIPFLFYWLGIHELFSSPLSIAITSAILSVCLFSVYRTAFNGKDLLILYVCLSFLYLNYSIYGNMGANLTLFNILALLIIFNNIAFTKKQVERIRIIIVALLFLFLITIKIEPYYETILIYTVRGDNFNNNMLGLLVLALYFQIFLYFENKLNGKCIKLMFFIAITFFAFKYINISNSRSSLISIGIFLILYIFKIVNLRNYRKMLFCMVIVILIVPFIYLSVIKSIGNIELFGKSIFTRSTVWESTINLIKSHPIIGCGTRADIMSNSNGYTASAHNVFLGIWKTLGIVPLITLMIYLVQGKNINHVSKENYLAKKAFLCSMLVCIFETMLNDSDIYLFFITLLMTIKENETEKKYDT